MYITMITAEKLVISLATRGKVFLNSVMAENMHISRPFRFVYEMVIKAKLGSSAGNYDVSILRSNYFH